MTFAEFLIGTASRLSGGMKSDDERVGVKRDLSRVIYCNSRKTKVCPAEICMSCEASSKERSRDDRENVEEDGESWLFVTFMRCATRLKL